MKRFYQKYCLVIGFIFLICLCIFSTKVQASNSIHKITMDIFIDSNGTAEVTEVWKVNLTSGTEGYKPYGQLGKSQIKDFSVSDDTGREYTTLTNWKTNASFNNKAYKCGINKNARKNRIMLGYKFLWSKNVYANI